MQNKIKLMVMDRDDTIRWALVQDLLVMVCEGSRRDDLELIWVDKVVGYV